MTIAEKVRSKQPISREEFQALVKKTNWQEYSQRVVTRVSKVADIHEKSRLQSLSAGCHHMYK